MALAGLRGFFIRYFFYVPCSTRFTISSRGCFSRSEVMLEIDTEDPAVFKDLLAMMKGDNPKLGSCSDLAFPVGSSAIPSSNSFRWVRLMPPSSLNDESGSYVRVGTPPDKAKTSRLGHAWHLW